MEDEIDFSYRGEWDFTPLPDDTPISQEDMLNSFNRIRQYIKRIGEDPNAINWQKKPKTLPKAISDDWDLYNTWWKRCRDEGIIP